MSRVREIVSIQLDRARDIILGFVTSEVRGERMSLNRAEDLSRPISDIEKNLYSLKVKDEGFLISSIVDEFIISRGLKISRIRSGVPPVYNKKRGALTMTDYIKIRRGGDRVYSQRGVVQKSEASQTEPAEPSQRGIFKYDNHGKIIWYPDEAGQWELWKAPKRKTWLEQKQDHADSIFKTYDQLAEDLWKRYTCKIGGGSTCGPGLLPQITKGGKLKPFVTTSDLCTAMSYAMMALKDKEKEKLKSIDEYGLFFDKPRLKQRYKEYLNSAIKFTGGMDQYDGYENNYLDEVGLLPTDTFGQFKKNYPDLQRAFYMTGFIPYMTFDQRELEKEILGY